jgi:hypothetical protein
MKQIQHKNKSKSNVMDEIENKIYLVKWQKKEEENEWEPNLI